MDRSATIEELCEGQSFEVQRKIRAAYWTGCAEGMEVSVLLKTAAETADAVEQAVQRTSNVVYLKDFRKG